MFRLVSSPGPPSFSMLHAQSIEKLGGLGDEAIGFRRFWYLPSTSIVFGPRGLCLRGSKYYVTGPYAPLPWLSRVGGLWTGSMTELYGLGFGLKRCWMTTFSDGILPREESCDQDWLWTRSITVAILYTVWAELEDNGSYSFIRNG